LTVVKSPSSLRAHVNWDCFVHSRQPEPRFTLLHFHEIMIRSPLRATTLRILTNTLIRSLGRICMAIAARRERLEGALSPNSAAL
jgi:hypothetical protein